MAYTLEEPPHFRTPHMGRAVHAKSLRDAGVSVKFMVALEMIGFFSDRPGSQRFPLGLLRYCYPDTGNFIAIVGKLGQGGLVRRVGRRFRSGTDLPLQTLTAPRWIPGIDFSDHGSYWEQGYRAVVVTDTAFCRNDDYHEPTDTIDTLDFRRMAEVVKGVHAAVTAP